MEEVHFTLTRDDCWHLQLHAFSRTKRALLWIVLVCVLVILAITYTIWAPSGAIRSLLPIFYALFFFVALFGLPFLVIWLGASRAGKLMEKRGMHVLTISAQGCGETRSPVGTLPARCCLPCNSLVR